MRGLLRDRENTRQAFLLVEALRGKTTLRQSARFCASEGGRALLAEHPSLLAHLSDRKRLAALSSGSLGRAYFDFVSDENLSAEGLVEASKIRATPPPADDITWFRERNREMHDLLHVVAGYGRDPLGEACVLAFTFAQNGSRGAAAIALVGAWRNLRRLRTLRALGGVPPGQARAMADRGRLGNLAGAAARCGARPLPGRRPNLLSAAAAALGRRRRGGRPDAAGGGLTPGARQ